MGVENRERRAGLSSQLGVKLKKSREKVQEQGVECLNRGKYRLLWGLRSRTTDERPATETGDSRFQTIFSGKVGDTGLKQRGPRQGTSPCSMPN